MTPTPPCRCRPCLAGSLFAVAALLAGACAVPAAAKEPLVDANFSPKQDARGFRWDIQANGYVSDGANDCFDGGLRLFVNNQQFNSTQRKMTPDGREYVLSGKAGNIDVTRRILVDTERSGARYIEIIHNAEKKPVTLMVKIHSNLGSNPGGTITDQGMPFAGGTLGKKDAGLCTIGHGNRPAVLFLLAARRSRNKPAIQIHGDDVHVTYSVTVKPKRSAAVLHWVAQRRGVSSANVKGLFEPFYKHRLIKPELPRRQRLEIVNFRLGFALPPLPGLADLLQPVEAIAEMFDVDRSAGDVLILGEEGRLAGSLEGGKVRVATVHGQAEVPLKNVAAVTGSGQADGTGRVFLRSGEILAGPIEAPDLRMRSGPGISVAVAPPQVRAVVAEASGADGRPPEKAVAFLATRAGNRLALASGEAVLDLATPWGRLKVPIRQVHRLRREYGPQPGYRLLLADGSRLPVLPRSQGLTVETLRFGRLDVPMPDLTAVVGATTSGKGPDEKSPDEVKRPFCRLKGDNLLVGRIDLPRLRVLSAGETTSLAPEAVRFIERADGDLPWPLFNFRLGKTGALDGRFEEKFLPIRSGDRVLHVPVSHLISAQTPPQKKERDEEKAGEDKAETRGEETSAAGNHAESGTEG